MEGREDQKHIVYQPLKKSHSALFVSNIFFLSYIVKYM